MSTDWQAELAATVAGEVRRYRQERGLTVRELSDAARDWGVNLAPAVLYKFEQHRRPSVSIAEWFALAAALRVPPALLVVPLGRVESMAPLPETITEPIDVLAWINGQSRSAFGSGRMPESEIEQAAIVGFYRDHDIEVFELESSLTQLRAVTMELHGNADLPDTARSRLQAELDWRESQRSERVAKIRAVREWMRDNNLTPPALPSSVAELFATERAQEARP